MPDDDEGPLEELHGLVDDALLVETLMGWDGARASAATASAIDSATARTTLYVRSAG